MDEARLTDLLRDEELVSLTAAEREELMALVTVLELPGPTYQGAPTFIRHHSRMAALELAQPDRWVLRPLADEAAAQAFNERRRDEHDRMWDGCGCKIDYDR